MIINASPYIREHGRLPRGRAYWRFLLVTDRVTEKDHCFNAKVDQDFRTALKAAVALAERRRAHTVVVFP